MTWTNEVVDVDVAVVQGWDAHMTWTNEVVDDDVVDDDVVDVVVVQGWDACI